MAIVVDKIKVAYIPAPKVACTSLKMMFYRIENGKDFISSVRNSKGYYIHSYYFSNPFSGTPFQRIQGYSRICVARDPIKRFLSSYSNRVCFHKELTANRLSKEAVDSGAIPNPNLEEFVDRLEIYRKHSWSIQHHTDPQVNFLGSDKNYYSKVYQMNELEQLRADLSALAGEELELPHLQSGGPKIGIDSLSSNAVEKLKKFYAKDYEAYDFL